MVFLEAIFHSNRTVGFKATRNRRNLDAVVHDSFSDRPRSIEHCRTGPDPSPLLLQPGGEASALQRLKRVQGLGLDIEVLYPRVKAYCHSNPHLLTPRPSHALRVLPLTHIRYSVETKPRSGYLFCVPYSPLFYLSSWSSLSHDQMPKVVCL